METRTEAQRQENIRNARSHHRTKKNRQEVAYNNLLLDHASYTRLAAEIQEKINYGEQYKEFTPEERQADRKSWLAKIILKINYVRNQIVILKEKLG